VAYVQALVSAITVNNTVRVQHQNKKRSCTFINGGVLREFKGHVSLQTHLQIEMVTLKKKTPKVKVIHAQVIKIYEGVEE
jgi:hypothetical protein